MVASYEWYLNVLEQLAEVTPQQVQQVAQKYLRPQNRVTGFYIPQSTKTFQTHAESDQ
jgi:predicted Zn-dependent peptidase